jgi:hypothetical protein
MTSGGEEVKLEGSNTSRSTHTSSRNLFAEKSCSRLTVSHSTENASHES